MLNSAQRRKTPVSNLPPTLIGLFLDRVTMYSLFHRKHPSKEPYNMIMMKIDVRYYDNSIAGGTTCSGVCLSRKDVLFEPVSEYIDLVLQFSLPLYVITG